MSLTTPRPALLASGSSSRAHSNRQVRKLGVPDGFDVLQVYREALESNQPSPIAAIVTLVKLMEASTASTVTGLASEVTAGARVLMDTQMSLGVRAGCQLWERFFASSEGGGEDFASLKKSLVNQGKAFCDVTAPACREKIATLAADFLVDGNTILTHGFSRTVISTLLKAHKQGKRFNVYVTEGRPNGMGMRTYKALSKIGIPCIVVLDSAVSYVMDRVNMVLVGAEAVVESGGIVSYIGTYQLALVARQMQKPFYALAESYKFLRHYPLSQTDLPLPKSAGTPLSFTSDLLKPLSSSTSTANPSAIATAPATVSTSAPSPAPPLPAPSSTLAPTPLGDLRQVALGASELMPGEMAELNPLVDVTTPELIDFIFTDLGAPLSPTSVSQYLVAQFAS